MDSMDGICPAIAIRQRTPSRNPRSTVATATEIHDHLRLLFARAGPHRLRRPAAREVARDTRRRRRRSGCCGAAGRVRALLVGFPRRGRRDAAAPTSLERLRKRGFRRLLRASEVVDGRGAGRAPAARWPTRCVVLVDRADAAARRDRAALAESLETAFAEGGGHAPWCSVAGGPALRFSERFECARCGARVRGAAAAPVLLQQPVRRLPDLPRLRQPDRGRPGPRGARQAQDAWPRARSSPGTSPHYRALRAELKRFARRRGIPLDVAWSDLAEEHRRLVLEGDEEFQGVVGLLPLAGDARSTRSRCACS